MILEYNFGLVLIAVHGFNGNARRTWTHRKSNTFWLQDFLPRNVQNVGVMTFGYQTLNSTVTITITLEDVRDLYQLNANTPWIDRLPSTGAGERPWAGYRKRYMMSLLYSIAFLCILSIEEVLRLEVRHIRIPGFVCLLCFLDGSSCPR